jgi:hypothetical protein
MDTGLQILGAGEGPGPPKQNLRPQVPRGAEVPSLDTFR